MAHNLLVCANINCTRLELTQTTLQAKLETHHRSSIRCAHIPPYQNSIPNIELRKEMLTFDNIFAKQSIVKLLLSRTSTNYAHLELIQTTRLKLKKSTIGQITDALLSCTRLNYETTIMLLACMRINCE